MKKFIKHVLTVSLAFVGLSNNTFSDSSYYEAYPPFLVSGVKPNVLIILDNSNSMDEDFYGEAVGSYSPSSKSVVAKKALRDLISELKDKLRVGLMTYELSNVYRHHIHNSLYFASYEPKSYCPSHNKVCSNNVSQLCNSTDDCSGGSCVDPCVKYCQTGSSTYRSICENQCRADNSLFDVDYFDEIIENYPIGSEQRNRYCRLVYPKTQRMVNPTDSSHYIYYKHAYPFYSESDEGTRFAYAPDYNPDEGCQHVWGDFCATDWYKIYRTKTGTSDGYSGYSGYDGTYWFGPTDTDIALGYWDFGRRQMWYHVGRTWFSNVSPGKGYLHVQVNDLVDDGGFETNTYRDLWNKLDPKENDESGYMSCSRSNKNKCSYIINAGLTPTAGTFKSAIDYFKGNSSPIQYRCQKTYVVYVTDGLPSVDENGNEKSSDELMPKVLQRIDQLRSLVKTINGIDYTFDIKTYVLGVGLSDEAKAKLDEMAIHGGTDINGHAYYADNPQELIDALNKIFLDILKRASSGTSVSVLAEKTKTGALMSQALFYPEKNFTNHKVNWIGYMYTWWFYNSKKAQNIREDTNSNKILDILSDYILEWDLDVSGTLTINAYNSNGSGQKTTLATSYSSFDETHPVWEAGEELKDRSPSDRTIYGVTASDNMELFTPSNKDEFSSLLGNSSEFPSCLTSQGDSYENLINYVRGQDISGCRSRTVNNSGDTWKLGDIIYSTPSVVDYGNYSVAFVGSNDGMLHAFRVGYVKKNTDSSHPASIQNSKTDSGTDKLGREMWAFIPKNAMPYLRYLADPDYCHLYFVDLRPYVVEFDTDNDGTVDRRILIGGMRFGGAVGCENEVNSQDCEADKGYVLPPNDTCPDPQSDACIGRSSYFALDITDPEHPQFLWEFSDRNLGFTYSGPAVVRRSNKTYVIFGEGPDNYKGVSQKDDKLYYFVLDALNGTLERTFVLDKPQSFSGRLFTEGLDYDDDNYTDYVFGGYSRRNKSTGKWEGGIVAINTRSDNPQHWSIETYLDGELNPITSKVQVASCFENYYKVNASYYDNKIIYYIFFGTGKWLFKNDNSVKYSVNSIYGLPMKCDSNGCDLITENTKTNPEDVCSAADLHELAGWKIDLNPEEESYMKERNISDPRVVSDQNISIFTTVEPTNDICGFGGRSRVWLLNCATGGSIGDNCTHFQVGTPEGNIILQLSGGNIVKLSLKEASQIFTERGNRATTWYVGIAPESPPPVVTPGGGSLVGRLLLWIER